MKLFVYGTLAPGQEAWPVLAPWATGTPARDAATGRLYDTGRGYPAATFRAGGPDEPGSLVHGVVVALDSDRAAAALQALDRYEGDEYERVTIRTQAGLHVATYAWIAPLTGCRRIDSGRWDERPEAETQAPNGR